jgi:hypothetical protein
MPKQVIEWGAGLKDTCPFDATFQALFKRFLDEPKLLEMISICKYTNSKVGPTLLSAVQLVKESKWADLHILRAQLIQLSGKSMFGSTKGVFWNHLSPCGTFSKNEACQKCKTRKVFKSTLAISFKNMNVSAEDNINLLFTGNNLEIDCGNCKDNKKVQTKYSPDSEDTWFCIVEVDLMPHYSEELFKISKLLQFGQYKLFLLVVLGHQYGEAV